MPKIILKKQLNWTLHIIDAVLTLNKLYLKQMRYADIIDLVEPML